MRCIHVYLVFSILVNPLDRSSIVRSILEQKFDTQIKEYDINDTKHNYMYFLADGIYPAWPVFAKIISLPVSKNDNKYAKRYERVLKDIER